MINLDIPKVRDKEVRDIIRLEFLIMSFTSFEGIIDVVLYYGPLLWPVFQVLGTIHVTKSESTVLYHLMKKYLYHFKVYTIQMKCTVVSGRCYIEIDYAVMGGNL